MVITCSRCKAQYNLDQGQISSLYYSMLRCQGCQNIIKIAQCPDCHTFYTISINSPQKSEYAVKCLKCFNQFMINFPVEKSAATRENALEDASSLSKDDSGRGGQPSAGETETEANAESAGAGYASADYSQRAERDSGVLRDDRTDRAPSRERTAPAGNKSIRGRAAGESSFSLSRLIEFTFGALSPFKLIAGATGVAMAYILVSFFNLAANGIAFLITIPSPIRNFLSLFPPGIIVFCFTWTSLVISRITLNEKMEKQAAGVSGIVKLFAGYFFAAVSVNVLVFILLAGLLIAFGGIPIAGPVIFSLVFFFIYLASLVMFIFLSVGMWFYPPIAVINNGNVRRSLGDFYHFIRKYNFRLGYIIPLMAIIATVSFLGLYGLHYGSVLLIQFISKNLLGEEAVKIFSSVPGFLQQAAWASLFGADMGLFRSLTEGILITHYIAGSVIGLIFAFLGWLLLSVLFSILSTLSANVYLMLERGDALEDALELRLMASLVLLLCAFYILRKILL